MVEFLGLSGAQWATLVGSFLLGLLVGILVRRLLGVALILFAIVILLMALGYLSPQSMANLLNLALQQAERALNTALAIKGIVPYSSISFVIGLVIGLLKG